MNTFHVSANLVDRLGWVLVHSAWQFALMALAALVLMHVTRRCSAASRYGLLLLALAAMVASPIVTLLVMPRDEPMALATVDERAPASDARQGIAAAGAETDVARSRTRESSDGSLATSATTPVGASEAPADSWRTAVDQAVRPWLSVIVGIWCLGVLTFAGRPLLSWHTVRRLRRVGVSPVPAAVAAKLRQTSERLRLRQTVQILQSTLTRVPVVIGYLRPVILLPVSVIAGVPTSQLEAILAHELAHVRRHDFLVNLLQTLIETLFFYHPAVWWLSHRIRVERENCCDDLAVSVLGNRVEYGRALLAIEELRGTSTALALGARGGSLLDRVQRLFGRDPAERPVGAIGIVGVGLLAIAILALGVWNSTQAGHDQTPARATAKPDASLDVVVQIPDAAYTRPTADDQRATATIPAEAWGKPVDGLRLAIVLRSPPIDKVERLCYEIVAENVSDHDIRFSAEVGIDTWHFFFKAKLADADGKQVEQQRGFQTRLGPRLVRFWLKPKERSVISSWATTLLKLDDEGKPLARLAQDRGDSSFSVKPGRYSLSAAMDLGPIVHSFDPISKKRTVLSPAKGEWSGKLQTGAVPVALFTEPAPADEAAGPTRVTFVIAQHVILHDGKIVTWEEVDKILDEAAKAGKIYPQFYLTNGGLPREEELREPRSQLYKKLYDAGKIDGMSVGSLSPRSGEHLDRIKTPADLVPDESTKQAGRVLDVGGQPLAGVEVFPLPAEHVNGVYLRDGRNRNPLEERITHSDRDGKVVIFPEPGDTLIAAVHPNGFAITTLAEFKEQMGRLQLQPWARVTGQRPAEGDDAKQSVDFTCYPVPGLSFHIYETEIAEDGRFDQKFVPPGKVIVSRSLSTGQGGSLSFPVETIDLLPGQSHKVPLGPIPDDAKAAIKDAEARRKQAEPKPKPADQSTDTTQPAPAEEATAKYPPIESRQAVAEERQALLRSLRDKHKHPPIELRIVVSEADREADGVAWFPINIMGQRKPVPADESGANLPTQEKLDDKWRGLLWDKAEHALLADGTWSVEKCDVAQSAQSTDLAPNFEIRITLDAAGGTALRRLTSTHLNQPLAILVDGTIISTPVIIEPFGADFVITGNFSKAAAEKLAATIRKPDSRKATVIYLRFAQAESAVAALKEEAARRKLRDFEATIDQRLNSIAITADADTLTALKEILDRLEMPVGEPKPESSAMSKLAGVWIAEKVTSSDEVVPKEKFPFELHFEKDKLIFRIVPPGSGKDRVHEIVVDETKTPATIDITREIRGKKETVYAIFRLEGDRLWIHSFRDGNGQPSEKRPTTFDSSKEERSDLLVLTRKPASP